MAPAVALFNLWGFGKERKSSKGENIFKESLIMKKIFSILGMAGGLLLIILGFLTIFGNFGDAIYSVESSYGYDSGYATFGSDYYTYSSNNMAEAASGAAATANNLREISDLLRNSLGWFMMMFGLAIICGFGIVFSDFITLKSKDTYVKTSISEQKEITETTSEENVVGEEILE